MNKKLLTCLSLILTTSFLGACNEDLKESEGPEMLITHSGALVTKESGETATFSMVLSADPGREITISILSSDLSEGVVEPSLVVLDESNWFVPITFTITGLSDGIVDGDIDYKITLSEQTDAFVEHLLESVEVDVKNIDIDQDIIIDPDPASFKLSSTQLITTEGGPELEFSLVLGSQPTSDVVVTLEVSDDSEGSVDKSTLTFSPENWKNAQFVAVTPLRDGIVDGDQDYVIEFDVSSTDKNYDAYAIEALKVKNIDVDYVPGSELAIRVVAGNITSGNKQSYDERHGIRIFQALKADIIMIQEFNMKKSTLRAMVNETFGPEFNFTVGEGSIPNGIVTRFPIIEHGAWESNITTNRDWDWAVVDLPGPKDILVVSVHLNTSKHNSEMEPLKKKIQAKAAEGDYYVLLGGDFNTSNRTNTQRVFPPVLEVKAPYPVDQNGKDGTNAKRGKPYDWVLCCPAWAEFEVPVVIGSRSYPNGHVFDSRVYQSLNELGDVVPVEANDSGSSNMQHMAVVRDFVFKY